jgi:hypothetical protein
VLDSIETEAVRAGLLQNPFAPFARRVPQDKWWSFLETKYSLELLSDVWVRVVDFAAG